MIKVSNLSLCDAEENYLCSFFIHMLWTLKRKEINAQTIARFGNFMQL